MNILLLGKGYIGTAINQELQQAGDHHVNWVSKADTPYNDPKTFERMICSVYFQKSYDVVINASGYTGRPNVDACEVAIDDTWYYNVTVPGMLASMCTAHDVHLIHVSSGCIYDGYDMEFEEHDEPNFGLCSSVSSWYSKTKHAGELAVQGTNTTVLRIRMPFCETTSERNVLMKLLKYDNIINQKNSMTNVEDLTKFVSALLTQKESWGDVYNVVNPQPVSTAMIINTFKSTGIENPNWKYIDLDELLEKHTTTGRSNCVLSTDKIDRHMLILPSTLTSLQRCVKSIRNEMDKETV